MTFNFDFYRYESELDDVASRKQETHKHEKDTAESKEDIVRNALKNLIISEDSSTENPRYFHLLQ